MSSTIPYDEVEESGARAKFLDLREEADLPAGGEIVLREEVEKVADAAGIYYDDDWPKERIVHHLVRICRSLEPHWERTRKENYARSYDYIQSREAEAIAEHIREVKAFDWGGDDA